MQMLVKVQRQYVGTTKPLVLPQCDPRTAGCGEKHLLCILVPFLNESLLLKKPPGSEETAEKQEGGSKKTVSGFIFSPQPFNPRY